MPEPSPKRLPVRFFESVSGNVPIREWLLSLSDEDRKIIGADVQIVEFGWPIGMPVCRAISGRKGLWEVRSSLPRGRIARNPILHPRRPYGLAGWVREEDATNARPRARCRGKAHERTEAMTSKIEKGRLGPTFDSFLEEQGIAAETKEIAVKRVIAWQLSQIMAEKKITKVEMARRLSTSRAQLDRLLDPDNDSA